LNYSLFLTNSQNILFFLKDQKLSLPQKVRRITSEAGSEFENLGTTTNLMERRMNLGKD